jgi:hypothetical protein
MGWAVGYDSTWHRDIGYGVPAVCDHPGCSEEIDRGISHVCGGEPYGGSEGCGLYFCGKHLVSPRHQCSQCAEGRLFTFAAKPDSKEWMRHKLTDESWSRWREENPEDVAEIIKALSP